MQFNQQVRVTGAIRKDWTNEQGKRFNSTRVYITTPLDISKGDQFGQATAEYVWGDEKNFDKLPKLKEGFEANVTFEQIFTGKMLKVVVVDVKPLTPVKPLP